MLTNVSDNNCLANKPEDKSNQVDYQIITFAKPVINDDEFNKWLTDRNFLADMYEEPLDRNILSNYYDVVEQFINLPENKATKSVFEIATQMIKKYLKQKV